MTPPPPLACCDPADLMMRVHEIDEELLFMGATDEYCRDFFRTGGGVCELVVGNRCKRHRACRPPLPPGKMCMAEFGQRGLELRQQACCVLPILLVMCG